VVTAEAKRAPPPPPTAVSPNAVESAPLRWATVPEASRALVDQILSYRGSKQPLELPNCGSVFKNPENSQKGAGRLIEAAGLKGLQVGQAQVSKKHANFVLNLGGATAFEIETLINQVSEKVFAQSGVKLEREVIVVGDEKTS
jgi:UDP-N-acetylmuramate dehydrogenase